MNNWFNHRSVVLSFLTKKYIQTINKHQKQNNNITEVMIMN
jgi:ssRNA-specific RNase YbeY (16S rRNA maturation enzyme)